MTFADELSKLKKVLRFRKMPDGKTCTVSSLEAAPPRYVCMSVCLSVLIMYQSVSPHVSCIKSVPAGGDVLRMT